MFDVALIDILSFFRQAAAAVVGASALHSFFFYSKGKKELFRLIDQNTVIASVAYVLFWSIGWFMQFPNTLAHIGISLEPIISDYTRGYYYQWPAVILLIGLIFASRSGFARWPKLHNVLFFLTASWLISTYGVASTFGGQEISYILHGWHSIITLGTVLVLDYLFFACRRNRRQLAMLNDTFSRFSVLIFVGLAIDIISTYPVLHDELQIGPRFFFVQTVVVILLVNGILLAGPLTRAAGRYLSQLQEIPHRLNLLLGLMGAISIVSWVTITFLDFVQDISLSYWQLAAIYLALIAAGFVTHIVVDGWPLGTKRVIKPSKNIARNGS